MNVGRILEGAFGLIREHIAAVAIWAGIYLAANVAMLLTVQPMMAGMFSSAAAGDPSSMMAAMLPIYGMNLVLMLVGIILYTAAMRAVLRPQAGGLGFLRVGMDELRILLLLLLFIVMGFVLGLGFTLIFGLLTAGAAAGSDSIGLTILVGFFGGLAVFGLFTFLLIRFSLAFPLTLHRRQFVIGEAWTLSKGRFWTLFGSALVVTLIGFMLTMVVGVFAAGSYFADIMAASGDPEAAAGVAERQMAAVGTLGPAMILQTLAGAVIGAVWIALSGGSAATAAKLMLAEEFDDAEAVFG
ncbi:hypothetical protein M9978_21200 [Sphingomonas sp. MG17]|uniref:Glycerophosphoryl diester phosphodiesterase membrane domain-containing protein n=1 Tax=Sphingomonas tagetis TaxID=2949092 RepID=A0A9X2HR92_9SPHN|nr:hypothetical protein [Sphingomonas tagetis]MCP3732936.1 hypothetical protein [Sphingomonas tagetis]